MTLQQRRPFPVRIFMPTGDANELRQITMSHWAGTGLVLPKSALSIVRRRPEFNHAGVYVLWGTKPDDALPTIYVGESDNVADRLYLHDKNKDFWNQCAVFTSPSLNKAHIKYIEARMIELYRSAKRALPDNDTFPQPRLQSEADRADAESFIDDLLLCLSTIGMNSFMRASIMTDASQPSGVDAIARELTMRDKGNVAHGLDVPPKS